MRAKKILYTGDIHMGSLSAVTNEHPVLTDGMNQEFDFTPTKYQQQINECWNYMLDDIGRVDVAVINGDTCDGTQKKDEALSLWTANKRTQVQEAAKLIKSIKADAYRISQGSNYHVDSNMTLDEAVTDALQQMGKNASFDSIILQDFEDVGVRTHVMHKVGYSKSTWQYLTTPLARDLVLLKLNDSIHKYGKVHLVVRSHAHIYVRAGYSSTDGFVTPAWQGPTPFMVKAGIITPPEIGYVKVYIEPDGHIDIHQKIFPMELSMRVHKEGLESAKQQAKHRVI